MSAGQASVGQTTGVRSLAEIDVDLDDVHDAILDAAIDFAEEEWGGDPGAPANPLAALVRERRALLAEQAAAEEAEARAVRAAQEARQPAVVAARAAILDALDEGDHARAAGALDLIAALLATSDDTSTHLEETRDAAVARGANRPEDDARWSAALAAARRAGDTSHAASESAAALLMALGVDASEAYALLNEHLEAVEGVCYAGR